MKWPISDVFKNPNQDIERSHLNIKAGCEMSEFSHGSFISTGFIFRSYAKTGRTGQSHGSQIEGTTRAVT